MSEQRINELLKANTTYQQENGTLRALLKAQRAALEKLLMGQAVPLVADKVSALAAVDYERRRQVLIGFDPKHDDEHSDSELALAAVCYALHDVNIKDRDKQSAVASLLNHMQPWDIRPPNNQLQNLTVAASFIVAEMERIMRRDHVKPKLPAPPPADFVYKLEDVPGVTLTNTPRAARCNEVLKLKGEIMPRTCQECGLGPCKFYNKDGTARGL